MSERPAIRRTVRASAGVAQPDPAVDGSVIEGGTALERSRDAMRRANRYYRRHRSLAGWRGPEAVAEQGRVNLQRWGGVYPLPFPPYEMENISARIRRAAMRPKKGGRPS